MAVVVGRMLAILEAQTAQFEARMTAAGQQINWFGGTTTSARRGVMLLQGGLQQLAFRAAGATGPVGRLAAGLLTLGAGGGVAIAAAAAVGSVALAIRGLTVDARDSKRAQDELIQSLSKMGPNAQITANRIRIAQLEQLRDDPSLGQRAKTGALAFLGPAFGGASLAEQRERLNREIAKLQNASGRAAFELAAPGRQASEAATLGLAQARERAGAVRGGFEDPKLAERMRVLALLAGRDIPEALAREIAARERLTTEINNSATATERAIAAGDEAALRRRMIGAPALAITEAMRVEELIRQGVDPGVAAARAREQRGAAASMQTTDILRTMGPQLAVQSILAAQQGGAAGFTGPGPTGRDDKWLLS